MERLGGRTLGAYLLEERLGGGGMGVVYRGVHQALRLPRAVKVLAPHIASDERFVERFRREATTAAGLRHPNIVLIHDIAEQDGVHYLVMDLVAGRTLTELIRAESPLPVSRAIRLLRQLAGALDYAHARGVLHRDVKPGNVLVGPDDQVTLVDFGLARAAEESHLTLTGAVVGTPEYMAPEVLSGGTAERGADLYALGVVAYELLTGKVPFGGGSTPASPPQADAAVHRPPPSPRALRPDLSAGLERVLLRQLAKDPAERYASGKELVAALAEAADERATLADVPPAGPAAPPDEATVALGTPPMGGRVAESEQTVRTGPLADEEATVLIPRPGGRPFAAAGPGETVVVPGGPAAAASGGPAPVRPLQPVPPPTRRRAPTRLLVPLAALLLVALVGAFALSRALGGGESPAEPAAATPTPAPAVAPTSPAPSPASASGGPTASPVASASGGPATPAASPGASGPGPTATRPAPPVAASPAAAASPEAFRTVLDERFATKQPGWPDDPNGTAWFADGVYRLFGRHPGRHVAVGAPAAGPLRDVVVSGRFRKVGGPGGGGYGLIVRDQGPPPRDGLNQGGRYYVLEVDDRGNAGAWRREQDRWVDLQPWTPAAAVRRGTEPNELEARALGPRLTLLVNGTQVLSLEDAALGSGGVGVYLGGDQHDVAVERFTVRAPG